MDNRVIGERIRTLREAAQMQSVQLATGVGLGASAMTLIEQGQRAVKSVELAKIADFLGVSPMSILVPDSLLGRLPVAARSTSNTVPVMGSKLIRLAELHQVLAAAGIHLAEVPTPPLPTDTYWLNHARQLAAWAREKLEISDVPWTFEQLADAIPARLGVDVIVESVDAADECGASITDLAFPIIFVNSCQIRSRAMFTLAHELGHILHQDGKTMMVESELVGDMNESFVNAFAAELLMPEDDVRTHIEKWGRTAKAVVKLLIRYQISYESFVFRLHNLHIIGAQTRDELLDLHLAGILSRVDDSQLLARVMELSQDLDIVRSPIGLLERSMAGYQAGVISAAPIAGLLDQPEDSVIKLLSKESDWSSPNVFDISKSRGKESDEKVFSGRPV